MSRYRGLAGLTGCAAVAVALTWAAALSPAPGAPVAKDRPGREIHLDSIYTNSTQADLRYHKLGIADPEYDDLLAVRKGLSGCRVSNLFLVHGDNFAAVLRDTRKALGSNDGAETEDQRKAREASKQAWLFLYLGLAPSEPPQWTVRSARLYPGRVVVSYSTVPPGGLETRDGRHYAYWVPLGELKAGRYSWDLVDHRTNETVLSRSELIKSSK